MKKLFLFVMALVAMISRVEAQELYAVMELDGTTMTIRYDKDRAKRGGVTDWTEKGSSGYKDQVTRVFFDKSVKDARPTSTVWWFHNFTKLETIVNLSYLNTENVTDMRSMFNGCTSLVSLDLSTFNTKSVVDMSYMFYQCVSLGLLDISSFNTENVTDMSLLFAYCNKLISLDLRGFNTAKVQHMEGMFQECTQLIDLDLNSFNLSSVVRTTKMFFGCEELHTIFCKADWTKAPKLEYSNDMFTYCNKLVGDKGTKVGTYTDITYARPDDAPLKPGYFSIESAEEEKELTGVFSIGDKGERIRFSQGNLQYRATVNTWRFALMQFDIVGEDNKYIGTNNSYWIDLFGWATSGYNEVKPWKTTLVNDVYGDGLNPISGTNYDWGQYNAISNGGNKAGLWRTLTINEWDYLIKNRKDAAKLQGYGSVACVEGHFFLPDDWSQPEGVMFSSTEKNNYSVAQWEKMEKAGAVFLPCGGSRIGEDVDMDKVNVEGNYWSSTHRYDDEAKARSIYFKNDNIIELATYRSKGLSVRLVKDLPLTVIFYDKDGNVLSSQEVERGQSAVAPEAPTVTGYVFKKWDTDYSNVQSDLKINPIYVKLYTVRFYDKDNNLIGSPQKVEEGGSATAPKAPEVTGYTFTGWDSDAYKEVHSDLNIHALYAIRTFTVTFYGMDDVVIKQYKNVSYGEAVTPPNIPAVDGYKAKGWDSEAYKEVTQDLNIHAVYAKLYTVKFYDNNGALISTQQIAEGEDAVPPEMTEKIGIFVFAGWDGSYTNIDSDRDLHAQYLQAYTVTFYDKDGNVLSTQTVPAGHAATPPDAPKVEGYTFNGWDSDKYLNVHEDMNIRATYVLGHTVTFVGFGDVILKKDLVQDGLPATPPDVPEVEGYHFVKWDTNFDYVKSDLTVKAIYEINKYKVTLVADRGRIDYEPAETNLNAVPHGTVLTLTAVPYSSCNCVLESWTNYNAETGLVVKSDTTVTANFTLKTYTVTFLDWDEALLFSETVEHGGDAKGPDTNPTRGGYTFTGWSEPITDITEDLTVIAQYKENAPTDIDNLDQPSLVGQKLLINGHLYILVGDKTYDATGRIVK